MPLAVCKDVLVTCHESFAVAYSSVVAKGRVRAVNNPHNLRDLVEAAILRHGTSGRQLAFLAQKEGFTLATTTVNAIRQGTYKSAPTDETIRAIAWLAGVSDEVAFTAAGHPVPGPPFAEELPPGVDNLSQKSRKAAVDMLRVLVDLEKDAGNASNPPHPEQPADVGGAGAQPGNPSLGQKTGNDDFFEFGLQDPHDLYAATKTTSTDDDAVAIVEQAANNLARNDSKAAHKRGRKP